MIGVGMYSGVSVGGDYLRDLFNRPDNASSLQKANTGQSWNAWIGTWGIQGGKAYCVTDVSMNLVAVEIGKSDYVLECITQGQITDLNNQRFLNVIFRSNDATNYLMTRITGGNLHLFKCVGGTLSMVKESSVANENGRDYRFTVRCQGNDITIYVDGEQKLQHTLDAGDTVFAGYTKVGLRLTKSGSPTMPAYASRFTVRK